MHGAPGRSIVIAADGSFHTGSPAPHVPAALDGTPTPPDAPGVSPSNPAGGPGRTVLVAGQHSLARAALRAVLTQKGLEVVAEAQDATEAAVAAARTRPSLCLLDAELPGGGVLAVRRVIDRAPGTLVVVVAPALDPERLLAALRAGASGYVTQGLDADGLARAIDAALAGQMVVPRAAVATLIDQIRDGRGRHASLDGQRLSLTRREAEVVERLRDGMSTHEIAEELELSAVTVRRHLATVAKKAGRRGRTGLEALTAA
jgi:DNA-binding NarL/FixJ family response regulator